MSSKKILGVYMLNRNLNSKNSTTSSLPVRESLCRGEVMMPIPQFHFRHKIEKFLLTIFHNYSERVNMAYNCNYVFSVAIIIVLLSFMYNPNYFKNGRDTSIEKEFIKKKSNLKINFTKNEKKLELKEKEFVYLITPMETDCTRKAGYIPIESGEECEERTYGVAIPA